MTLAEPLRNAPQRMDGAALLRTLDDRCVAAAFFDPQHRDVLDKMKYGNEGARQKKRAEFTAMTIPQIRGFIGELQRVLQPSGYLFLWTDKFALVSGSWQRWIPLVTPLCEVGLFVWDKDRLGMGKRERCVSEFLIVLQRGPRRAKDTWRDHSLRDVWVEAPDRKRHAHAKPIKLIERLIEAVTDKGDLVCDPAAGGYAVLEACAKTKREFVGCDLRG